MNEYRRLSVGDPVARFVQRSAKHERLSLDNLAGRYTLLIFCGAMQDTKASLVWKRLLAAEFDRERVLVIAVTMNGADRPASNKDLPGGFDLLLDNDRSVSRAFGAAPLQADAPRPFLVRQIAVLVTPMQRVAGICDFDHIDDILTKLKESPPPEIHAGFEIYAPVLVIPDVFEPALCRMLIETYRQQERPRSGYMVASGQTTFATHNQDFKIRRDCKIEDETLLTKIRARIARRVATEIAKVHQFEITRIERHLVGCYAAEDGGHFAPHRDNTTPATAHRRFALSINLNDDFEGGSVWFPEYGPRGYKVPAGSAVVFSCSMLHAVRRVTHGVRYAYLSFFYDAEGDLIRAANLKSLSCDNSIPDETR